MALQQEYSGALMDWEVLGQFMGVVVVVLLGFASVWKKLRSESSAAPPPERTPAEHELREKLRELRAMIERNPKVSDEEFRVILRTLDRVEDMLTAMRDQMSRIEASQRLTEALISIGRHPPKT